MKYKKLYKNYKVYFSDVYIIFNEEIWVLYTEFRIFMIIGFFVLILIVYVLI